MPQTPKPPAARRKPAQVARKVTDRVAASAKPASRATKAAPSQQSQGVAPAAKPRPAASPKATLKSVTRAGSPTPKPSKDELRAEVERLAAANANLRAKSRDAGRAAKAATARVAELEAEVARLTERSTQAASLSGGAGGTRAGRGPRRRAIDPGDAVPPGVGVLEPQPLDAEAEAALEALKTQRSGVRRPVRASDGRP